MSLKRFLVEVLEIHGVRHRISMKLAYERRKKEIEEELEWELGL